MRIATARGVRPVLASDSTMASTTELIFRFSGSQLDACSRSTINLLRRETAGVADLTVLTDLSLWAPEAPAASVRTFADAHETSLAAQLPGVSVMAYTVLDVLETWPAVRPWPIPGDRAFHATSKYPASTVEWLRYVHRGLKTQGNLTRNGPVPDGAVPEPVSNLLSYFTHEPSLCLWLRRRRANVRIASRGASVSHLPQFVWVVEADAPFLGSLREPLVHYSTSAADYIGVLMPHREIASAPELFSNDAFRRAFPGSPTHKWEHVERFSAQLLSQIDGLLGDGIAAFGEIFAGTVCNQTASCTCADLRDAGYVQRQGLLHAWSKPVSRRDLRRLFSSANKAVNLNDTRGRGVNRWIHAVHGSCDVLATVLCGARENAGRNCTLGASSGPDLWLDEMQRMAPHGDAEARIDEMQRIAPHGVAEARIDEMQRMAPRGVAEARIDEMQRIAPHGAAEARSVAASTLAGAATTTSLRPAATKPEHATCGHGARPRVFAYPAPLPPYTRVLEWRTGFVHKLFRRSPYYTTNGDCADLYFIPNMDVPGTAYRRSTASVVAMFEHVARTWPWWNRTGGGARHFVYSPCDHGPRDCMFNGHLYAGRDVRGGFDVPAAIAPKDANRTIGYIMLSGARFHSHFQSGRDIRLPTPEGHTCGPFCGMPQSVRENRTAATLLLRQLSPWTTTRSAVEREGMLNAFRPTRVFFGGRQGGGGRAVLFHSH